MARRFFGTLDYQEENLGGGMSFPANYPVVYDKVSFAYKEEPVLKEVSFAIKEKSILAIVGLSGSGKSTIANLLNKLYNAQNGQILFNGLDINEIMLKDLRDIIQIVRQHDWHRLAN